MLQIRPDAQIQVTLVMPQHKVPVWLQNLFFSLHKAEFVSLYVVVLTTEPRKSEPASLLFDAWKWLDTKVFRRKVSAVEHSENLVDICGEFDAEQNGGFSTATLDDATHCIQRREADVIVWMLSDRPPTGTISVAKFGVWTIADAFNKALGFRELVNREPVTRCDLIIYGNAPSDDRILATTFATTDCLSLARGINAIRVKCEALLLATIRRTYRRADPRIDGSPVNTTERVNRASPGFLQLGRGLLHIYGQYSVKLLARPFYFDQWQIAYRIGGNRLDQEGLKRLAPSHRGFWADPFVAEDDGRTFIFFEEFLQETSRGHICAIEIGPDGEVGQPINVLHSEYHLSYPFLFRYDGSLYMVPECAESGRVEVFRCTRFPDVWEPHAVLLDGVCAFDPTLIEHDGMWWMFVTIQHDGNSTDDELHLFYASGPFDEWTAHPLNPIQLDVRSARPAGSLFREQGRLFRPSQDCSARYGWAISIQEVRCMTTEDYKELEVGRITSDWAVGAHGTHTINQASGVTVYDCEAKCRK